MPGLVDSLTHASAHGGGTINFALGDNKDGEIKVSELSWKPRMVGSGIPRLNRGGSWPAHVDPRELVVDMQGRIVSASPSAYWTTRTALIESILVPDGYDRDIFHHGTLTVELPGQSDAYLLVNLLDYDIPLTAQIGRSTEYRISWVAYFGYWRAVSGDAVVFL